MTNNVNTQAPARQHDYWFDNIKGILMIAVVVGHMIAQLVGTSPSIKYLYNVINTFHMGSFLILSGYLSKRRIDQKDYVNIINKNIIPYLIAQVLLYAAAVILPEGLRAANSTYFNRSSFSFLLPVYQLWYLMGLIIFNLFSARVQPKRRPVLFMIGAILVSLACGYVQQINVFKLTKVAGFYPLFLLGYLLPKNVMQYIRQKKWVIAASVLVWISYLYFFTNESWSAGIGKIYGLSTAYENCDPLFLGIPAAAGRLVFLLIVPVVGFSFFALCPRRKTIFSKLGQNSLYIFVLHTLIVVPVRCLHYEYRIFDYCNTYPLKLGYLLFCVACAFLLGSNWVKKIFKPILDPNIDIRTVVRNLCREPEK